MNSSWKLLFIVVASIIAVYARSVTYDFVTYDDYELVARNEEYLANPSNVFNAFTTHAFTSHRAASGYYRPLLLVSFIADYHLWGLRPAGYHFTNILLHCSSAVVLFLLLNVLFRNAWASLLGALVFALHPVQTESVGWVAGRNDVMLGLFILLMAYFYVLSLPDGSKKRIYRSLSIVAYAAALFTKESAAFYLLLLPVLEATQQKLTLRALFTLRYARAVAPFIGCLAGYIIVRAGVVGGVIGAEALYGTTPFAERVAHLPAVVSEQVKFIVVPFGYSVVHPVDTLLWREEPWTVVSWCIFLLLIAGIWHNWSAGRPVRAGAAWFAIGLLPLLGLFPLAVLILEHRLYVPMAGVAVAIAGAAAAPMENPVSRKAIAALGVVFVLAYAILSTLRLQVWQNSETLWLDAIGKAPTASRSYFNLAGYYFERGQYNKTVDLMKSYVGLKPDDPMGYIKLRQTLQLTGRNAEAEEARRQLIECYRRNGDTTRANELGREPQ